MDRRLILIIFTSAIAVGISLFVVSPARGGYGTQPLRADSPYDLIDAVNALRISNGLPAYTINATLMYTAQSHAEFMAATGNVSHTGAGGSTVTDRLLSAGYPLAGDLSLGGFRSENITGGAESKTAQEAVNGWMGDAPHLNTMLSPNLTEIGAGVAVADGRVYYVIDCARPASSAAPQSSAPSPGSGTAVPEEQAGAEWIPVAVVSTPNSAGDVFHVVQSGQTLWQIAITYNVKVDEIKAFNNLIDNNIFPGEILLIKKVSVLPAATVAAFVSSTAAFEPSPSATSTQVQPSETAPAAPAPAISSSNQTIMLAAIGIIALALLGGGIIARTSDARNNSG